MPVTPYHLGPGLVVKAAVPERFSLTAFTATEVLVDVESLVNLLRQHWPVHARLHSLVGAVGVGLAVGGLTIGVGALLSRRFPRLVRHPYLRSEIAPVPALAGGILGGLGASLLDAVVHGDVRPFWPFSVSNPLLGLVGSNVLHIACGLAAAVGLAVLIFRSETA